MESQIQPNNDIISQIKLQIFEEKSKHEVKVLKALNVEALSHRLDALEQQVTINTVPTQDVTSDHNESESISLMKTQIDHLIQMNEIIHKYLASMHEHVNEITRRMDHLEIQGQTSETSKMSKIMHHFYHVQQKKVFKVNLY